MVTAYYQWSQTDLHFTFLNFYLFILGGASKATREE